MFRRAGVLVSVLLGSLLVATGGLPPPDAEALPFLVSINTSVLSGMPAQLAFDLVDGDGAINNSASVSGFATDGVLGVASTSGGVAGALPGLVTISDTDLFNELLQGMTLANSIGFTLNLTTNFAGAPGIPDAFSFFILDAAASLSLVDTDLPGDALFSIAIDGSSTGTVLIAASTTPNVPVSVIPQVLIPDPSPLLLVALGLPMIFTGKFLRSRRT